MRIWYFLILLISSCASTNKPVTEFTLLSKSAISSLEKMDGSQIASLDRGQYLVQIEGAFRKTSSKNKTGLIFVNDTLKQKEISLESIFLKNWIKKILKNNQYYIERLSTQSKVVVLVEYGTEELVHPKTKEKLQNRYLKMRAIDYSLFKKNKTQDVFWEARISSLGYDIEMKEILPKLAAFLDEAVEKDVNYKMWLSEEDPRFELTKQIPTAISVDEFKPTVEELKFFN